MSGAAARDTAYYRASSAYKTVGARVFRTDMGVTDTYLPAYNASTMPAGSKLSAGWYLMDGRMPFFAGVKSGTQSPPSGTVTKLTNWSV